MLNIDMLIWTVKERVRAVKNFLEYENNHIIIIRAIVKHAIKNLNSAPVKSGRSKTISTRKIITGKTVELIKDC